MTFSLPALENHSHIAHLRVPEPAEYPDLARSCFLPVKKHPIDNQESVYHGKHLVVGLALMPTENVGEHVRLGRTDVGDEESGLSEDRLEVQSIGGRRRGGKSSRRKKNFMLIEWLRCLMWCHVERDI